MIRRLSALLFSAFVVLAGCSDAGNWPLAPGDAPASALTGVDVSPVVEFANVPSLSTARHAEKWISAAQGGSVELNGFRVDVPAGALPYDALITIDLPTSESLAKRVIAELGPHGIQFNTPVTITFPLEGTVLTGQAFGVARWENGGWTPLGGTVSANGKRISSTTPHFSGYAVAYAGG